MSGYANILPILQTMAAVICLGGALLLLLRGRDSRSRRMLAAVMSIWGLIYATRVAGTLMGNSDLNFTNTDAADTLVLVAGNFFLIVLLLYPLEVVRPGWLSLKRAGMLLLPYAALSLLYYAGLRLLGQEPRMLRDTGQFMEHIGEFNVWYRLLMIVSIVLYLAFLFRLTWRYKEVYRQWCRDNYSDDKDMDISWLRRYGIGVMLIGVAYFWLLFDGSTYCLIVSSATPSTKDSSTTIPTRRISSVTRWTRRTHAGRQSFGKNGCRPAMPVPSETKACSSKDCPRIATK